MRFFLVIFVLITVLSAFPGESNAQNLRESEVVVIKGEKFVLHQVRTGETIFSITKKYKIERTTLEKYNPKIVQGLSIGEVLKIPYRKGIEISAQEGSNKGKPTGFTTHKVKSKRETAYFIAKKYDITVEELYDFNPKLKRIKKGTRLQIPYWNVEQVVTENTPKVVETENNNIADVRDDMLAHKVVSGETLYSIARKYNISEDEVLNINPEAGNLKAGATIYLPKKSVQPSPHETKFTTDIVSDKYFEHIIESGETLWGTARKYRVSENELKAINPVLNTGFPAGAVIRIPVKEIEKTAAKPVNDDAFKKHYVKRKETLYGVSRQYNVSIPEIVKYNPVLETRNLVYGETILIPEKIQVQVNETEETVVDNNEVVPTETDEEFYAVDLSVEIPEGCQPDETGMFTNTTYDIALFLPLFLEANDTLNREDVVIPDSLSMAEDVTVEGLMVIDNMSGDTIELEERKELFKHFYSNTENFVQFYEGVLLAVDELQGNGMDIRLNVFDTQRKKDSIRQYIYEPEFLETDLIIGPIYPNVQTEVAQIAAKNRIPMVSPLAPQSSIISSNPEYYQVNTTRDYLAAKTVEMVAEEYYNSNFIIFKTKEYAGTSEERMVNMFREKFFNSGVMSQRDGVNFTIYDFKRDGIWGLRRIMSETKENVVYIPASVEGDLSIAISNLNNLSGDYSITLIGTSRYPNFQSIQVDYFHNLKMKYVAPYWVDYTKPSTIAFVEHFKQNFGTEPNNFGMQGYDVTKYFMNAFAGFGVQFNDYLPYLHTNQVQGNYHFEKVSQFGGYINQGVSVISYTRDYNVLRERVKGQPRLIRK